jgi:putative protease
MNSVELLSPAGDAKSFKAAILAGANAIFFGVENFNARQRAENISFENLSDLIKLAKSKNVKSYLTLNTLVFDSEFSLLVETVQNAIECGIDAVIIQDMGVLFLIKKFFPDLEIHASTQMTTHNILQCEFLSEVGVSQINLSRELSLIELKSLVKVLNEKNIVAEIFVHGAYCISFSGQCYFSNYLYGEAGNRGLCVQPCRREFCSSNKNFITPFNLKDNCAINFINELKDLGKISLTIEGRIQSFDYVWAITNEWKNNLENNFLNPSEKKLNEKNNLIYKVMNRSYSDDYLKGEVTSSMFTFGSKDHSFVESGFVISYTAKNCRIKLSDKTIQENDKILIKDKNDKFICSGFLTSFDKINQDFILKVNSKEFNKIFAGYKVFIQKDIINKFNLENEIEKLSIQGKKICVKVFANENKKLSCEFICKELNYSVSIESNSILQIAQKNPLTKEVVFEKFNRLGQTEFCIDKIDFIDFEENLFLPLKELNEIRRQAISFFEEKLNQQINENSENDFDKNIELNDLQKKVFTKKEKVLEQEKIYFYSEISDVLKNENFENEKTMLELPCVTDTENFLEKINFIKENKNIIPYFPAIIFDNQLAGFKNLIDEINTDRIIFTENTGLMFYAKQKGLKVIGGQHLNITNSFSAKFYSQYLSGFVPSFEIPENEIDSILKNDLNLSLCKINSNFKLLMQSRQCLVKKLSSCKKENCDLDCIKNCSKKISFKDKNGKELIAVKRKGFYSAIFATNFEQLNTDKKSLNQKYDLIVYDYRKIFE